jgi:alpha-ribazole phosphatase
MMKIHLIRHGKTEANEKRLYCGSTDLPLSENGAAEIVRLNEQGIYPPPVDLSFYTSGLLRTEQTLSLLYGPVKRTADLDLAEIRFGAFEMKSYEQLKMQDDYQAWITDESGDAACPGGESKNMFQQRVLRAYEKIVSHGQSALVSCHGGVIVCIMESLFPNQRNFYEWQPQPGYGYTMTYIEGRLHKYTTL